MADAVENRFERFLATEAGARFLAEAETEAAAKEAAVEARRDLVNQKEGYLRRRHEVLPLLQRKVEETEAAHVQAREAEKAAQRARSDAGSAAFNESWSIREGINRADIALRRTADPRILAGIEEADEARRLWNETAGQLYRFRTERAVDMWGGETWVKRSGNNQAGLDAMKKGLDGAQNALELLALVAEPTEEEVSEGIARVKRAIVATQGDPPPITMVEYDREGRPKKR